MALVTLLAFGCVGAPNASQNSEVTFNWSNKLVLSAKQQELLHLYTKLENASSDAAKQQEIEQKIGRLKNELGTNVVRRARADEVVISQTGQTNVASLYNPSPENIAFTVSIKGDEEWMGSKKGSMGRDTYLPPHGTLLVTNLYWTTPGMTFRK